MACTLVPAGKFMHEDMSTTSKPSRLKRCVLAGSSLLRLPLETVTLSEVTA